MSVQLFASLIRRHEGDPEEWVNAVYDHSEDPENELMTAIQHAQPADCYATARALEFTLSNFRRENTARIALHGMPHKGYAEGLHFLAMIIQALDSEPTPQEE